MGDLGDAAPIQWLEGGAIAIAIAIGVTAGGRVGWERIGGIGPRIADVAWEALGREVDIPNGSLRPVARGDADEAGIGVALSVVAVGAEYGAVRCASLPTPIVVHA